MIIWQRSEPVARQGHPLFTILVWLAVRLGGEPRLLLAWMSRYDWHPWFAWYPVVINSGFGVARKQLVWLEWVYRQDVATPGSKVCPVIWRYGKWNDAFRRQWRIAPFEISNGGHRKLLSAPPIGCGENACSFPKCGCE